MKYTPRHVAEAEARISEARTRLLDTLGEIQQRMRPSVLAQDAVESAAHGVATVARKGADAVRKRPIALAAVAGTIGLFMARGVIGQILTGGDSFMAAKGGSATEPEPESLKPERARPKPARRAKGQPK